MLQNKYIFLLIPLLFLSACIKQYTPVIDSDSAYKIVVSGRVSNIIDDYQYVSISKSIALDETHYEGLTGCEVSIFDEFDNEFQAQDINGTGRYRFYIDANHINIGTSYYIKITTPDGDVLQSEPEIMTAVAPIKQPKYHLDSIYNGAFNYHTRGLQFTVNVDGSELESPYYLFELDATYEHHAKYAREWYYDGSVHHIYPPDSSLLYCWTTKRVPEVITLATDNLEANKFNNFDLHFVPFNKDDLTYGYSLLVRQIGLSRKAYLYWESMRLNNNQNAELYSSQPVDTQGNIKNITHPEKEVLGFFGASEISEYRIFVEAQETNPNPTCSPWPLGRLGFREIGREKYPGFLMNNPAGTYFMVWLPEPCVDCSYYSGTTNKPNFWPY